MEQILIARYAPLQLPHPLSQMPTNDYQKYMPKFFGTGEYTVEEHLETFYAYAENINIEAEDVWMRIFVQSLDGEARKWFKKLPAASIGDITALDDAFLKEWGDRKDYLHYITEFGNLRRKNGESISDFSKRFNKLYDRIPEVIKPSETSTQITYSGAFDYQFCLLLREREPETLSAMQEAAIKVESNLLASEKLKGNTDRKKRSEEASTSSNSNKKVDKLAKMLETLTYEMSKIKLDGKSPAKGRNQNDYLDRNQNRNQSWRRNNKLDS